MDKDAARELWLRYSETRSVEDRNALVEHYYPYARRMTGKQCKKLGQDLTEKVGGFGAMLSAACEGLIESVERFDLEKKVKFETFAYRNVTGRMQDYLRKIDHLSRCHRTAISKGEEPPVVIKQTAFRFRTNSFSEDDERRRYDAAEDPEHEGMFWFWHDERFKALLTGLSSLEKDIMWRYYCTTQTFKDIGDTLGFSESRISQLHSAALRYLRKLANQQVKKEAAARTEQDQKESYEDEPIILPIQTETGGTGMLDEFYEWSKSLVEEDIDQEIKETEERLQILKLLRQAIIRLKQAETESSTFHPGSEQYRSFRRTSSPEEA